jgi:PAS domain S-box-containing protein
MEPITDINLNAIVDSLSDGLYVCDLDRRITYWSKSAERITGWTADDVLGLQCFDNVLCHIDKDGHPLCGQEYCPLHRSIVTGTGSDGSLLVFAQSKGGERIPMLVSVAPLRNAAGDVIGGVETFQDASAMVHDLERAKTIQQLALHHDLPEDPRIKFATHYVPHAIVGGDYYAIEKLNEDSYGLMLADVMGHGIAAALYTMHLSSLWNRHRSLLRQPAEFAARLNNELVKVVKTDESFATAVCGLIDLREGVFRFAGAGGPQVLRMRADGTYECFETAGLPLAIMEDAQYDEARIELQESDRLLLFSDGALEISNAAGEMLELKGLIGLLKKQGYPAADLQMEVLEEDLLKYSNGIRLADDLTLIEIRIQEQIGGSPSLT